MAERPKGMGRGLAAILAVNPSEDQEEFRQVPVDIITPNPNQPRRSFDEESLLALAESIRQRDQRVLVEDLARLLRVGSDQIDRELTQLLGLLSWGGRQDRCQTTSHCLLSLSHERPPPLPVRSRRPHRRSAGRDGSPACRSSATRQSARCAG